MSQFAFLQAEFPDIFQHVARAETLARTDPRGAAFYCRLALETAVGWLYRHDGSLRNPYDPTLAALLAEPSFQTLVGRTLAVKARFVKDAGNAAAHGKSVSAQQAATSLREFFHVAYWLARTYAKGAKPPADAVFRIEALPRVAQVAATTIAQLQEVARRFKETVEARDAAERRASDRAAPILKPRSWRCRPKSPPPRPRTRRQPTPTTTARLKPATCSSTYCCARPGSIRRRRTRSRSK
jgi:type I restriction enzyme R subunit